MMHHNHTKQSRDNTKTRHNDTLKPLRHHEVAKRERQSDIIKPVKGIHTKICTANWDPKMYKINQDTNTYKTSFDTQNS